MAIAKRKQKFFDVEIPLISKTTQARAFEVSNLNNKFMKYDLTRMLRGKSMILQSQIKVEKDQATSIPKKISLMPYYLKRMVRKGTNYVEDSFVAECKDAKIKIKPFLVTRRKVSRAVRKALRNKAREELIAELKTKTSETIFRDLLRNDIQKPLSLKLKKIYPLSLCEIKEFKVINEIESKKSEKKETPKEKPEEESEGKKE